MQELVDEVREAAAKVVKETRGLHLLEVQRLWQDVKEAKGGPVELTTREATLLLSLAIK